MTTEEVKELGKAIFADGIVTKEEVLSVWNKKEEDNIIPEFYGLFLRANVEYLLSDGKIDDEEAALIIEKINEDGQLDFCERGLLVHLAEAKLDGVEVSQKLVEAFPDWFI